MGRLPQRLSRSAGWSAGGAGVAQGLGIRLFAFGGAYWPLATAHSDPLWVRTCFGQRGGGGDDGEDVAGTSKLLGMHYLSKWRDGKGVEGGRGSPAWTKAPPVL